MASDNDIREELEAMKCAISDLSAMMKKKFADEGDKEEMAEDGDDEVVMAEEGEEKDEMGELTITHEDEEEAEEVIASKSSYGLRARMARIERENAALKAELTREKFAREIEIMEQEGYRIPDTQRDALVGQLQASRDPVSLLESWRELFARDPIGTKIDMSRAAMPKGMGIADVGDLVKQFAGKPEEFAKAINARTRR
jgi:hypothetical protein